MPSIKTLVHPPSRHFKPGIRIFSIFPGMSHAPLQGLPVSQRQIRDTGASSPSSGFTSRHPHTYANRGGRRFTNSDNTEAYTWSAKTRYSSRQSAFFGLQRRICTNQLRGERIGFRMVPIRQLTSTSIRTDVRGLNLYRWRNKTHMQYVRGLIDSAPTSDFFLRHWSSFGILPRNFWLLPNWVKNECISISLENFMLLTPVSYNNRSAIFIPQNNVSIPISLINTETLEYYYLFIFI